MQKGMKEMKQSKVLAVLIHIMVSKSSFYSLLELQLSSLCGGQDFRNKWNSQFSSKYFSQTLIHSCSACIPLQHYSLMPLSLQTNPKQLGPDPCHSLHEIPATEMRELRVIL